MRWCWRCACFVTYGIHDQDGRFDPQSVLVLDEEIARAIQGGMGEGRDLRGGVEYWLQRGGPQRIREAHDNIALGIHIGTYRKWGIDDGA